MGCYISAFSPIGLALLQADRDMLQATGFVSDVRLVMRGVIFSYKADVFPRWMLRCGDFHLSGEFAEPASTTGS